MKSSILWGILDIWWKIHFPYVHYHPYMNPCACDPADNDHNNKLPVKWSRKGVERDGRAHLNTIIWPFLLGKEFKMRLRRGREKKRRGCSGNLTLNSFSYLQKAQINFYRAIGCLLFIFSKMHSNGRLEKSKVDPRMTSCLSSHIKGHSVRWGDYKEYSKGISLQIPHLPWIRISALT